MVKILDLNEKFLKLQTEVKQIKFIDFEDLYEVKYEIINKLINLQTKYINKLEKTNTKKALILCLLLDKIEQITNYIKNLTKIEVPEKPESLEEWEEALEEPIDNLTETYLLKLQKNWMKEQSKEFLEQIQDVILD